MKVIELYRYLDKRIPSDLSCDWDNDGLMCSGDPEKEVEKVLVALDITEKTVKKAVEENFDVIISHHPMIFKKIGSLEPSIASARKAIELIKKDISAMSFHTRLDAVSEGVNDILCEKIGVKNAVPFGPDGEKIGRIGTLDKPLSLDDFCNMIKISLDTPFVLSSDCGKNVHRVAVLGGDGKDFVSAALNLGADTYISGHIGYNTMCEAAELGINLIEAGHFYTENPVCTRLAQMVKDASSDIKTEIFNSNEVKVN